MGEYITEVCSATCYINKADFPEAFKEIKLMVSSEKWRGYGWRDTVLSEKCFEKCLKRAFGIELKPAYGDYVMPVIKHIYVCSCFEDLMKTIAPYMTSGEIIVDYDTNNYARTWIKFENGQSYISYE